MIPCKDLSPKKAGGGGSARSATVLVDLKKNVILTISIRHSENRCRILNKQILPFLIHFESTRQ